MAKAWSIQVLACTTNSRKQGNYAINILVRFPVYRTTSLLYGWTLSKFCIFYHTCLLDHIARKLYLFVNQPQWILDSRLLQGDRGLLLLPEACHGEDSRVCQTVPAKTWKGTRGLVHHNSSLTERINVSLPITSRSMHDMIIFDQLWHSTVLCSYTIEFLLGVLCVGLHQHGLKSFQTRWSALYRHLALRVHRFSQPLSPLNYMYHLPSWDQADLSKRRVTLPGSGGGGQAYPHRYSKPHNFDTTQLRHFSYKRKSWPSGVISQQSKPTYDYKIHNQS